MHMGIELWFVYKVFVGCALRKMDQKVPRSCERTMSEVSMLMEISLLMVFRLEEGVYAPRSRL